MNNDYGAIAKTGYQKQIEVFRNKINSRNESISKEANQTKKKIRQILNNAPWSITKHLEKRINKLELESSCIISKNENVKDDVFHENDLTDNKNIIIKETFVDPKELCAEMQNLKNEIKKEKKLDTKKDLKLKLNGLQLYFKNSHITPLKLDIENNKREIKDIKNQINETKKEIKNQINETKKEIKTTKKGNFSIDSDSDYKTTKKNKNTENKKLDLPQIHNKEELKNKEAELTTKENELKENRKKLNKLNKMYSWSLAGSLFNSIFNKEISKKMNEYETNI